MATKNMSDDSHVGGIAKGHAANGVQVVVRAECKGNLFLNLPFRQAITVILATLSNHSQYYYYYC